MLINMKHIPCLVGCTLSVLNPRIPRAVLRSHLIGQHGVNRCDVLIDWLIGVQMGWTNLLFQVISTISIIHCLCWNTVSSARRSLKTHKKTTQVPVRKTNAQTQLDKEWMLKTILQFYLSNSSKWLCSCCKKHRNILTNVSNVL